MGAILTNQCSKYLEKMLPDLLALKGTVIIEDTSGFHKGNILSPGESRDILTFTAVDSII